MPQTKARHFLYGILAFLLFFMPYSTWALQSFRFAFEKAGHPLPLLLQKAMIGWKELLLTVMVLLVVWIAAKERALPFRLTVLDKYLAAFAVLGTVIGFFLTGHLSWTIFGFRYDFSPFLYYVAARTVILNREQLLSLMRQLAWASVPCLLFGLAQTLFLPSDFLTHFGYSSTGTGITGNPLPPFHYATASLQIVRAMSTFPGPNSLALYAVMVLLIVGVTGRNLFSRGARWTIGALAGLALLATFSRGHLLGLLSGLAVGYAFWLGTRPKSGVFVRRYGAGSLTLAILGVTFAATILVGAVHMSGASGKLLSLVLHDSSTIIHKDVRLEAWEIIKAHPFGTGLGTSGLATTNTGGIVSNPESWYVQITVELGWLGLLAALGLIVLVFRLLAELGRDLSDAEDRRLLYFFVIGFAAVAVGANFLPSWFEVGSLYWWILFGFFLTDYAGSFQRSEAL